MTRLELREELLETWIAETNSDFFTDTVLNNAIGHEYRYFAAETGAGPVATFSTTADGTTREYALPVELVAIRRVDYSTTREEIPFLAFEAFSTRFGSDWLRGTAVGEPDAYAVLGDYSIVFEPIPANTIPFRVIGPIVPDMPTSDGVDLLVSEMNAYVVAARAYVWVARRKMLRDGQLPPNYEDAVKFAREGTEKAKAVVGRYHGGHRVSGRLPSRPWVAVPDWNSI